VMAAAFVQDPDRPGLHLVASIGMDDAGSAQLTSEVGDPSNPFAVAVRERTATFGREAPTPSGDLFTGAYLPLVVATGGVEAAIGVVGFGWSAPRVVADDERVVLTAVADLIAVALDRARLGATVAERSDWFERMAHTDPLTGLANDRTVARILELELARAGRQGSEVSIALFDVDDFRATNREGGHEAGDDVLRQVAAVLAESVRLVDTVGRIGGDEFILVAPGSAGSMVAQRVIGGIGALPAVAGRTITVSAGVARFPTDGSDVEGLIAAATAALEEARATDGRGSIAETSAASEG
jgi:diguanylate cyclase (GGDEF)-like protein